MAPFRLVRDHAPYLGPAQHALATARLAAGQPKKAEHAYSAALKTLEQRSQWREAAAVARELARVVRDDGRDEEAFELLDKATMFSIRQSRGVPLDAK